MNHRTRLDWMFMWPALFKIDPWLLRSEKISLKSPLKLAPGAGWAMQCASFIFLKRRFEQDKELLSDMLDYYKEMGVPYQILLFPEGTDMTANTKAMSLKFANENDLPPYDYVLHPRTAGFTFLVNKMRNIEYLRYVYDITVSYKEHIAQQETDLLAGICPEDVYFHVERYDIRFLPENEEDLSKFCQDIWAQKEEVLRTFYNDPRAEGTTVYKSRDLLQAFQLVREDKGLNTNSHSWPIPYTGRQKVGIWISFLFWLVTSVMWSYFFLLLTSMRLYFGLAIVIFLFCIWRFDGVESLVLRDHP